MAGGLTQETQWAALRMTSLTTGRGTFEDASQMTALTFSTCVLPSQIKASGKMIEISLDLGRYRSPLECQQNRHGKNLHQDARQAEAHKKVATDTHRGRITENESLT